MNHRWRILSLTSSIALCALVYFCASSSAAARHRSRASSSEVGDFSYYLLSLSWSPAFCLESPGSAECGGSRRYGFIVHGLWPQNEKGWPEHCSAHSEVPESVVQGISNLMPARGLVYHEWSAHGTCSGLEPAAFFDLVRRAYEKLSIPPPMSKPTQAIEMSPTAIASAFLQANPKLLPQSVVVTCSGQSAPRLQEVRVCLDKDLTARACSNDALRGACRASQLIIPPVR